MALSTLTPSRTASARCPVHHQDQSFYPSPELADALDTLRDLHIHPTLVDERHMSPLDDCGGCTESRDWLPETAVIRIGYTASNGARWHTDACPLCVEAIVTDLRKHATGVKGYIPVPAGSFGSVVAVS